MRCFASWMQAWWRLDSLPQLQQYSAPKFNVQLNKARHHM